MNDISVRDYFAIQLAAAWLSTWPHDARHPTGIKESPEDFCEVSYALADAMLAARKQGEDK